MEKPLAILCDIDGTLALLGERNPYDASQALLDAINYPISNILEVYSMQTVYPINIILVSGRQEKYRKQTEEWLQKYNIKYADLYLRKDNDYRKDFIVKKEIYEKYIKDKYKVLFVLDDRDQVVKMWRTEGLTCLQVAYGDF